MANPFKAGVGDASARVLRAISEGKKLGLETDLMLREIKRQEAKDELEADQARAQIANLAAETAATAAKEQRAAELHSQMLAAIPELAAALHPAPAGPGTPPELPNLGPRGIMGPLEGGQSAMPPLPGSLDRSAAILPLLKMGVPGAGIEDILNAAEPPVPASVQAAAERRKAPLPGTLEYARVQRETAEQDFLAKYGYYPSRGLPYMERYYNEGLTPRAQFEIERGQKLLKGQLEQQKAKTKLLLAQTRAALAGKGRGKPWNPWTAYLPLMTRAAELQGAITKSEGDPFFMGDTKELQDQLAQVQTIMAGLEPLVGGFTQGQAPGGMNVTVFSGQGGGDRQKTEAPARANWGQNFSRLPPAFREWARKKRKERKKESWIREQLIAKGVEW